MSGVSEHTLICVCPCVRGSICPVRFKTIGRSSRSGRRAKRCFFFFVFFSLIIITNASGHVQKRWQGCFKDDSISDVSLNGCSTTQILLFVQDVSRCMPQRISLVLMHPSAFVFMINNSTCRVVFFFFNSYSFHFSEYAGYIRSDSTKNSICAFLHP